MPAAPLSSVNPRNIVVVLTEIAWTSGELRKIKSEVAICAEAPEECSVEHFLHLHNKHRAYLAHFGDLISVLYFLQNPPPLGVRDTTLYTL